MRKTVIQCAVEHATQTPNKIAVVDHGRETSYGELLSLVKGYRTYLAEFGVKKGDIVVLRASQNVEFVVSYLSVHSLGAIFAPVERNMPKDGVKDVVSLLHAPVIIADDIKSEEIFDVTIIPRGDVIKTAKENVDKFIGEIAYPALDDTADILFTTGTTGTSKGVELTHKALAAISENLINACQYRPDTVIIAPGPVNHASAIRKIITSLINGSTVYPLDGMFDMKAFYDALDYDGGSIACCLPQSAVRILFQLTDDKIGEYADKIDFIETNSSPLPEADKIRLCRLLPKTRLYNHYGSTESSSTCLYDFNAYPGKIGCIGKPSINTNILIVDDERKIIESSPDRPGLIACKSDVNMKGYVNAPEITKEVLVDGVVYTNDIGYIGEDGFVYIVGRQGDVINVGGLKVPPTEVESAALFFPGIEECICIAVDDKITGKALKLLVVLKDGKKLDTKSLKAFLASKLESHKVPRYYEAADEIKKTKIGKLDRKAYR